jgi:orotidine-5'-phosphate decarboxylase
MNRKALEAQIEAKKSVLCVGLDTDLEKIPAHLLDLEDPIFEFNKAIIDATHQFAVAYKPNLAFYEAEGLKGWKSLERTINYLDQAYPECFTIADAKRGDIGNTWIILLALTSNPGAVDFQFLDLNKEEQLFQRVLKKSQEWATEEEMMFVVGATKAAFLEKVRALAPNHFLLVPGVGAQGGSVSEVMQHGMAKDSVALLINSSRGIIYASQEKNFAIEAAKSAQALQIEMARFL